MFQKFFEKFSNFGEHHQTIIAALAALSFIIVAWGVEKILDEFILPHKPLHGYMAVVGCGLFMLWLIKHVVLRVI